ncbi:MAG: hypothetical protein U0350_36425 [Caldilineaceae bacterium]
MSLKNDWKHGDYPTAAFVNSVGAALDAAHAKRGDAARVYAVRQVSSAIFSHTHRARYLWFRSTGQIKDPAGVGETISISDENNSPTKYDLNQVAWLFYGYTYEVTGVTWCIEAEQ